MGRLTDSPDFRLTLRPLAREVCGAPPAKRLARVLKALLRSYGFRATKVEALDATGEPIPGWPDEDWPVAPDVIAVAPKAKSA